MGIEGWWKKERHNERHIEHIKHDHFRTRTARRWLRQPQVGLDWTTPRNGSDRGDIELVGGGFDDPEEPPGPRARDVRTGYATKQRDKLC